MCGLKPHRGQGSSHPRPPRLCKQRRTRDVGKLSHAIPMPCDSPRSSVGSSSSSSVLQISAGRAKLFLSLCRVERAGGRALAIATLPLSLSSQPPASATSHHVHQPSLLRVAQLAGWLADKSFQIEAGGLRIHPPLLTYPPSWAPGPADPTSPKPSCTPRLGL